MRKIILLIFFIMLAVKSFSQVQEQLTPTEKKQLTVVTEPLTLYKGFFRAGIAPTFSVVDKLFLENGKRESLPTNGWASSLHTSLYLQYGITDRLMVEAGIPFIVGSKYQSFVAHDPSSNASLEVKWENPTKGFGDMDFTISYQLMTESITRPALGLFVTTTLPTAEKNPTNEDPDDARSYENPAGNGYVAINPTLRMRKVSYPFSYTVSASYKYKFEGTKKMDPSSDPVDFKDADFLNFTASFYIHLNDWIVFKNLADYYAFDEFMVDGEVVQDKSWLVSYTTGVSFQIKQLRIDQIITLPIAGKLTGADPGYTLIVQYTF